MLVLNNISILNNDNSVHIQITRRIQPAIITHPYLY